MEVLGVNFEEKKCIEILANQLENLFKTYLKNRYGVDIDLDVYLDEEDNGIVASIVNDFDIAEEIMNKLNDDFQTFMPPAFGNDMLVELIPTMSNYSVFENYILVFLN